MKYEKEEKVTKSYRLYQKSHTGCIKKGNPKQHDIEGLNIPFI